MKDIPTAQQPSLYRKVVLLTIGTVAAILLVGSIIGFIVGTQGQTTTTPAAQPTQQVTTQPTWTGTQIWDTPTQAPVTQQPQTPTAEPKWTTTETFSGNGAKKTKIFLVPDDWKILYTCSNETIAGTTINGYLSVTIYDNNGAYVDLAINAQSKTTHSTGETEEHQSGVIYLDVIGTGGWMLQVQEFK
jgi:hypothetical protein